MAWQGPMEVFYHPAFLSNGIWTPAGEKEERSIYQHSGPWSTYTRIIGNVQLVIYWIFMQYRVNKGGRVPGAILQRSHSIGTTFLSTWGQHVGSPWPEKALTQAPPQTLSCYHFLIWTSHAFHPNPRPCSLQVSLQRRVLISPVFLSFLPCFSWSDTLHSLQWLDLWVEYPENTKQSCSMDKTWYCKNVNSPQMFYWFNAITTKIPTGVCMHMLLCVLIHTYVYNL